MTQDRRINDKLPAQPLDWSDTSSTLIAAALVHLDAERIEGCFLPVPDTNPALHVAAGPAAWIAKHAASQSQAVPSELASLQTVAVMVPNGRYHTYPAMTSEGSVCCKVGDQLVKLSDVQSLFSHSAATGKTRPTDDELWDETIRDRDQYHEWADKLAEAISKHFGAYIGEHSNTNCPWAEALEAIENAEPGAATGKVSASVLDLPTAIMNLPCKRTMSHFAKQDDLLHYKEGHRDARHAAADLVLERADELAALASPAAPLAGKAEPTEKDVVGMLRRALDKSCLMQDGSVRAEIVGHFCNEWNAQFSAPLAAAVPDEEASEELKKLRNRVSELEAARIAYASEFPLTEDGDPDVGNIHANIRALKARLAAEPAPILASAESYDVTGPGAFKNFHRSLCARFGYTHDEHYWWRDLVSLEEHIARLSKPTSQGTAASDIDSIADELEQEAMNYESDFAYTVKGCVEALRHIAAQAPADRDAVKWGHNLQQRLMAASQNVNEDDEARQVMAEAACLLAELTGRPSQPAASHGAEKGGA